MLALAVLATASLRAGAAEAGRVAFHLAGLEEGRQVLGARDEFVSRMSAFDRAARLKRRGDVPEEEYLAFARNSVMAWTDADRAAIRDALGGIQARLDAWRLPFPARVLLVKTTGREEGGAAYTRGDAIVLPAQKVTQPTGQLRTLIAHELFHILSRRNPDLREQLYRAIGFRTCTELTFPPALKTRKITNPDAPRNDQAIRVAVDGRESWAIPILFSRAEHYDPAQASGFFDYLQFRFLLVALDDGPLPTPRYDPREPSLVEVSQLTGFFEQVGRNTGYIIHPEEILADNFAQLLTDTRAVPSPDVLERIERILLRPETGAGG